MSTFLSQDEINKIGFKSIGTNILISKFAIIRNANNIILGDHIRIDDFTILSAGSDGLIEFGNNIHIGPHSLIYGAGKVTIGSFSTLSSHTKIYTINDDYSGNFMTNPMVPNEYRNVNISPVYIGKHVIVGSVSTIIPGVKIEEGVAIGAMSFVNKDCVSWTIYAGVPIKIIKERFRNILELEKNYIILS